MRRDHARLVGKIIFSNLLEYPLHRYRKMIEAVETSPLMRSVPVRVKRFSQTRSACLGEKGSSKVIAQIVKNGRALAIRYTYEGFNQTYIIQNAEATPSAMDSLLYRLRRISSRNELTYQVLKGIIEQQGAYLRTGNPLDLVPLTQVDLAKAMSREHGKIDNSWISRLIGGLSVRTPSGEEKALKFFFPTQKQVNKFFIKDLLDREAEDLVAGRIKKPYSDAQIQDILRMRIAEQRNPKSEIRSCWSVAQCRREMGIPSAQRRRSGYRYPPLSADFSVLYPLTVGSVQRNAPASPGIYEFRLRSQEIAYPNGKTPVIYIGSTMNIRKRLAHHLGKSTKNGRIRDFLEKYECFFRYRPFAAHWRQEERRLYQLFVSTYGIPLKCNRIEPGAIQ